MILLSPLLAATVLASPENEASFKSMPLSVLEERLVDISEELEQLASYSLRGGLGSKGHRSAGHSDPDHTEWIEIDLGEEIAIDQIALVPSILRDTKKGFVDESFPLEFRVIVGTRDNREGIVVAAFNAEDRLLPRIAPLVIDIPNVVADWVRVEATKLTPRGFEGRFFFQLAEIFVFSGFENVALRKPVKSSSALGISDGGDWRNGYAVDGFIPHLMDAAQGEKSLAFVGLPDERPVFTIDLEKPYLLSQINLHAVEQNATVPLTHAGDFGLPKRLIVEGANQEDFSDAKLLVEHQRNGVKDIGPITALPFAETYCRFVRLTAEPSVKSLSEGLAPQTIGFAEIELISGNRNVALNKSVVTNLVVDHPLRSIDALTDGLNFYGQILPIRIWINELARRHDLEFERPLVIAELNDRYARQKANLNRTYWLIALLGGVIVAIILIDRIVRLRQIASIKERLAADLHDELGADLHAIGLLSDLAEESKHSPEELAMLHKRIRNLTIQSGNAVRHCTNMLDANTKGTNLKESIHRASNRIMAKLENTISIEGEEYLNRLKAKTRFDLYLFYNECLVNISRHSGATAFSTLLTADKKEVRLSVSDNGRGLTDNDVFGIPKSLKRRARLLGAKVAVEKSTSGGTCINLKLRTWKWGRRK